MMSWQVRSLPPEIFILRLLMLIFEGGRPPKKGRENQRKSLWFCLENR
jgi:hypothetical protein